MPRYFFHTQNGDRIRDEQGEDLPNVEAAREEAVTVLGEILRYRSAGFWDTGVFSVIVTDAEGVTVVSVTAKASQEAPQGWALADADE